MDNYTLSGWGGRTEKAEKEKEADLESVPDKTRTIVSEQTCSSALSTFRPVSAQATQNTRQCSHITRLTIEQGKTSH